ncbi:hypothetical protein N4T77_08885 [Clostridium sp. CX1]|uniref:hypothetical protein n=1 Tax=Clostridium sp. CX1 TaxID=2978346 RepID=UPI0021BF3E0D|nr:hypothetical protein [Clostridium sp. CX1]MCT8976712.1 hypothetical protein [Clostridium sp. CX1]
MLNFKKIILPALLAASILAPSVAYASSVQSTEPAAISKTEKFKEHHKNHKNFTKELEDVEKYVPGAKEQVRQILTERRELHRELKDLQLKKLGVDTSFMNEYRKVVQDTHDKVKSGQMTKEDAKKHLEEEKKKFETNHGSELAKLKQAKEDYAAAHRDEISARKDAMKSDMKKVEEVEKALKDAVKADESDKVKDAYNNYLKVLKESNKLLKDNVSKLRN